MPNRRLINRSFLALSIGFGLHAAIIDPLDDKLMGILFASEALMGRDEYCMNYLTAFRAGRLNE
jgi:5-methyltetrahydrofolate--homocysteine methyltransferase